MSLPKKNTSKTDFGIDNVLTPEQEKRAAKFNIRDHFTLLYWEEPFFHRIFQIVERKRIDDDSIIPTAGVSVDPQTRRPTLYWNPRFFAKLSGKQVRGILKHEAYHLIYSHCTDRAKDPHTIWNWAADLAINGAIPRDELPESGFIPGEALKTTEEAWNSWDETQRARFKAISDLVESMPPHKVAEYYFARFMNNETVKEMVQEAKDQQAALEEMMKELMKGTFGDDHEGWGDTELSEGEKQMLDGEIRGQLAKAVKEASASNSWGSMPAEMQALLEAMITNTVDWKALLKSFAGRTRRANWRTTIRKVNRKYPYVHPGRTRNFTASVVVYVDMSGSVGDKDLALAFGELNNLARQVEFEVVPFDHSLALDEAFTWKKGQKMPTLRRVRAGGTDFNICIEHLNKNVEKYDAAIIVTDGECSHPPVARRKVAYVIVPGRKLLFEGQLRENEICINMEHDPE